MVVFKGYESSVTFELSGMPSGVHLIDPMDGAIYELPETVVTEKNGLYSFKNLPVRDYPMILTFGDF